MELLEQEGLDGIEFPIHTTALRQTDGQVALGIEFWKDIGLRPVLTVDENVAYKLPPSATTSSTFSEAPGTPAVSTGTTSPTV